MHTELARIALLQIALVICSLMVGVYFRHVGLSALAFGLFVSFSNTVLLAWRYKQGKLRASLNAGWALKQAQRTVIERFILVVILLAVGYELLGLLPLWILSGFVAGQVVWIFALVKYKAG